MSPPLVVFDLDGTLIDSRRDLAESTNELLTTYGASALPMDAVAAMVGDGARRLVERALGAAGLDLDVAQALDRFLRIYDRRLLNHTRLYDGVADLVAWAAPRACLAVLTNKPEAPTRTLLDALHLSPYFRFVIGGDSSFARKPDPEGLRHLIAQAETTAARTLMVGDSMIDVETARRAGALACAVLYGFGHLRGELTLAEGEFTAETTAELRDVVGRFSSGAASS